MHQHAGDQPVPASRIPVGLGGVTSERRAQHRARWSAMNLDKPTDRAQVILSRQNITITEWSRRRGISMLTDPVCTIGVPAVAGFSGLYGGYRECSYRLDRQS